MSFCKMWVSMCVYGSGHTQGHIHTKTPGYSQMSVTLSSCSCYTKVNVAVTFSPHLLFWGGGGCVMNCVNLFYCMGFDFSNEIFLSVP